MKSKKINSEEIRKMLGLDKLNPMLGGVIRGGDLNKEIKKNPDDPEIDTE